MKIYQYHSSNYVGGDYIGKLHGTRGTKSISRFLCGQPFDDYMDECDPNKIDFSKGICKHCCKKYKKDLNFEVIKLKLGIKV